MYELSEGITLDKNIKHNIEIVVDRLVVKEGIEKMTCRFHRKCIKSCGGTSGRGCDRRGTVEFQPEFCLPGLRNQY